MKRLTKIFKKMFPMAKKELIAFFGIFVSSLVLFSISAIFATRYPSYIYIENEDDLDKIRQNLNGDFLILKGNISISENWEPIGTLEHPFTGTINGQGATISFNNISFAENDTVQYAGLFGCNRGTIKNINFYLHAQSYDAPSDKETCFGFVTAYNYGSISSCTVKQASGSIEFSNFSDLSIGSICGRGNHNFIKCASTLSFDFKNILRLNTGGIVGMCENSSTLQENFSFCKYFISDIDDANVGGIIGSTTGEGKISIQDAHSKGSLEEISNTGLINYGGMVGLHDGNDHTLVFKNCYSTNRINNVCIGFLSGYVGSGICDILNSLSKTTFSSKESNSICSFFSTNPSSTIKNSFYSGDHFYASNYSNYISANFNDLTLSSMKWDKKIWIKNNGEFELKWI